MIIQIRGTSGSGKSTVMKRVMDLVSKQWAPVYKDGRKQPLLYQAGKVTVLGHYETPCGGCDTIGSAVAVFELITSLSSSVILCEGLLLSEDVKWSSQLKDIHVFYLTTPIQTCLSQIRKRRIVASNSKPLNETNTTKRVAVIERSRIKLSGLGVDCQRCSADQGHRLIYNLIRDKLYA